MIRLALLLVALLFFPIYAVKIDSAVGPEGTCSVEDVLPDLASATNLNEKVLRLALTAYNCAVVAGLSKEPTLTIIDYSLPSTAKRLWIFDLVQNKVLFNTYVAHGKGSGEVVPDKFSNTPESHTSSIGLFLTDDVYQGKHGYSMKIYGLEKGFNDSALDRNIVVHGAPYVSEQVAKTGRLGRSWGCPAIPQELVKPVINAIKNGSVMFSYYPDPKWLEKSTYLHCNIPTRFQTLTAPPM